ncbi:MAG: hypothetical protein QW303_01180, partial [Nitrososphaerota archaeon]
GMILQKFKINKKAIPKCMNIITNNLTGYLQHINRFPENNEEVIEALCFLNKKCFEDFTNYLSNKYPNINLLRENNPPHLSEKLSSRSNDDLTLNFCSSSEQKFYGTNEPAKLSILNENAEPPKDAAPALSKEAANLPNGATYDLLRFLANPLFLQLCNLFNNSVHSLQNNKIENFYSQISGRNVHPDLIFDEILEPGQVQELIKKIIEEKVNASKSKEPRDGGKKRKSEKFLSDCDDLTLKSGDMTDDNDEIVESSIKEANPNDEESGGDDFGEVDLSKNVSKKTLPMIEKRVFELISLKSKYLEENNKEMVDKIDKEKEKIIEAVRMYKEKLEGEMRENEEKMRDVSAPKLQTERVCDSNFPGNSNLSKRVEEDRVENLDLIFDPSDHNDLRNIVIKVKSDRKIVDITLVSYYLPFNPNNVTRFNNKFSVYFNDRINQILIQPAKYNVQTLIDYIGGQINFLDFSINENNLITIKNKMEAKFDLNVGDDTIFPLLGFVDKIDNYKDKLFYSASQPYNMECNEKVYFSLAGSAMEPLLLEFDKNMTPNKSIKKSNAGVRMKQLMLKFTNSLGQCYDFVVPFKMCFRITYAK